ncbi:phosphonate C-P lyase system protein PhnH [Mesorhizobium sp. CAU 1732]|uniref:phosphonate C-P lyase system protein PhnH n=1 Tax=Mesorhizobium sp. CAU 1732 TaxID=3140358 RepID=UPI0032606B8F
MTVATSELEGGFSNPVFEAQTVFKALMDAMARPGSVQSFAAPARPPAPLTATAAAIALTITDHDTPVWLDPELAKGDAVRTWLGFQTGAPFVAEPELAAFALISDPVRMPALGVFAQGTAEYPDRSATLILQVDALDGGDRLTLEGPGIEHKAAIAPSPMPADFLAQWRENGAAYPLGVDLVLAAPDEIVCLPRTTRISANSEV